MVCPNITLTSVLNLQARSIRLDNLLVQHNNIQNYKCNSGDPLETPRDLWWVSGSDNVRGDMKKYQLLEDMEHDRKCWMTKMVVMHKEMK